MDWLSACILHFVAQVQFYAKYPLFDSQSYQGFTSKKYLLITSLSIEYACLA